MHCTVTYSLLFPLFQSIRYSMLNFLRDTKVRVSIFLQEKQQYMDGRFAFPPVTQLQRGE